MGWAVIPRGTYPRHWGRIARRIKEAVNWQCIRCGAPHDKASGHVLTVHHWDGNKSNCRWWNLLPLCQRCHLYIQARVNPDRPWIFEHSPWFRPYVAAFYARRYLGEDLSRRQVEANLEYYLSLERQAVIG